MSEDKEHLGVRVPSGLMQQLEDHLEENAHVSKSELVRDALRRYFDEVDKNE